MAIYKESMEAFAKINFFLKVCGKRTDGYHILSTLMQSVSICDYVTLICSDSAAEDKIPPGIFLSTDSPDIPSDERNTAYKAARAFLNFLGEKNISVNIHIQKGIPSQAGMGGGSADAAAVLGALSRVFPDFANKDQLLSMAGKIGADVPFCMAGGTQLCEGIGDILSPIAPLAGIPLLFIKPICSISTPKAFSLFDSMAVSEDKLSEKIQREDAMQRLLCPPNGLDSLLRIKEAAPFLYNDMEIAAEHEYPVLSEIRFFLMAQGALAARMSGSGSTVFGIFEDVKTRDCAIKKAGVYKREGFFIKAGYTL